MNKLAQWLEKIPHMAVLALIAALAVAECVYVLFEVLRHLKPW